MDPLLCCAAHAVVPAAHCAACLDLPGCLTSDMVCTHGQLTPLRACSWELLPGSMASKRGGHAVAAAGGQLYALGGFNSVQAIPHCEAYEPRVSERPLAFDCCSLGGKAVCAGRPQRS